MNAKIAILIQAWHEVYVALGECIESARVVLDQSDRGTLLPDRVREMRGEMLATLERIPKLALLMETLTDQEVWPMSRPDISDVPDPVTEAEDAATAAEVTKTEAELAEEALRIADTGGESAPVETPPVDEEATAETAPEDPATASEPDATGAP